MASIGPVGSNPQTPAYDPHPATPTAPSADDARAREQADLRAAQQQQVRNHDAIIQLDREMSARISAQFAGRS